MESTNLQLIQLIISIIFIPVFLFLAFSLRKKLNSSMQRNAMIIRANHRYSPMSSCIGSIITLIILALGLFAMKYRVDKITTNSTNNDNTQSIEQAK